MAWSPVLEEVHGAMNLHEAKELLISHVMITVHGHLCREEEDGPRKPFAAEAAQLLSV
jgi:hypothetical protein